MKDEFPQQNLYVGWTINAVPIMRGTASCGDTKSGKRMPVTHQGLLDAMDGIAMILDHDLRITQIGVPNWHKFLHDNPPEDPPEDPAARNRSHESVLDRPVTQFIVGDAVRSTFAELFNSVLSKERPVVRIDYRCDAPTLRRDMRLTVSPIPTNGEAPHLLYQSVMLSVQQRPAIPMFGAPVAHEDAEDILTICAICARVAWPIGAPSGTREWIEPTAYYRRGGAEVTLISHGFCEECFSRLREED